MSLFVGALVLSLITVVNGAFWSLLCHRYWCFLVFLFIVYSLLVGRNLFLFCWFVNIVVYWRWCRPFLVSFSVSLFSFMDDLSMFLCVYLVFCSVGVA